MIQTIGRMPHPAAITPLLPLLLYQVLVGVLAEQLRSLLSSCVHPRARAKVLPLVLGVPWSRSFD